jgi:hypothetical protein
MAANGPEMSQLANLGIVGKLAKPLKNQGVLEGKFGGGGQTRTVDSADMSRVL